MLCQGGVKFYLGNLQARDVFTASITLYTEGRVSSSQQTLETMLKSALTTGQPQVTTAKTFHVEGMVERGRQEAPDMQQ